MGRGLTHLISIKGLNSVSCYSGRQMYTCVPLFETMFLDGLACRLPVFLTMGETFQNGSLMLDFTKEGGIETSVAVNTS